MVDLNGLNQLGDLYDKGYGDEQNYSKAVEYYMKAAKHGDAIAFSNLGVLYFLGKSVKQDYSKAKKYYEIAIALGNSLSLINLGLLYKNGHGVFLNKIMQKQKNILKWQIDSAIQGHRVN